MKGVNHSWVLPEDRPNKDAVGKLKLAVQTPKREKKPVFSKRKGL